MRPFLFLDIDGALNAHSEPGADGGLDWCRTIMLRDVVVASDCLIVVSSAWRYMGIGSKSVLGQCLASLGAWSAEIQRRIIDKTPLENGPETRDANILRYLATLDHVPDRWVALDDLPEIKRLGKNHYVKTDPRKGLTALKAGELLRKLGKAGER